MGCHPQTIRDRCARGDLAFALDPESGHRRIAASELEARGYTVSGRAGGPARRSRGDFHATLQAEVEGLLTDDAADLIAERLRVMLTERDEALTTTCRRLGEAEAALRLLARARFWQRRRLLAQLRASGLVQPAP